MLQRFLSFPDSRTGRANNLEHSDGDESKGGIRVCVHDPHNVQANYDLVVGKGVMVLDPTHREARPVSFT